METSATLLYFAYGSNMSSRRLRRRVPSATPLGPARLGGHRLHWHMPSMDGSGKCDVQPHPQHEVWGVLYGFPHGERGPLDQAEGLGLAYSDCWIDVEFEGRVVQALAYRALRVEPARAPYDWYRDFVLAGADEHGLPPHYRAALASVQVIEDPDASRVALNRAILRGA